MKRIFFGATLPDITKVQIASIQRELGPHLPGARFEGKDKLHITLQFIGDFNPEKIPELHSSFVKEKERVPFKSSVTAITGISVFPNEKVRRGIWLDCKDDGTLEKLSELIKSVTVQYGIIPEARAFKPHITVARLKEHRQGGVEEIDLQKFTSEGKLSFERFFPKSVALFESVLSPDRSGSKYTILNEYPLKQSEI